MRFADEKPLWLYVGLAGADVHERPDPDSPVVDRLRPESVVERASRADKEARGWISVRGDGGRIGAVSLDACVHPLIDHGFAAVVGGRRERPDAKLAPGRPYVSFGSLRAARVLVGRRPWWLIRDHDGSLGWMREEAIHLRSAHAVDASPEARAGDDLARSRIRLVYFAVSVVVVACALLTTLESSWRTPWAVIGILLVIASPKAVTVVRRRLRARADRRFRPW